MTRLAQAVTILIAVLLAGANDAGREPEFKPGSKVTVTQEGAKVMFGTEVRAELQKGDEVQIMSVKGKWVGVALQRDGKNVVGWLQAEYLREQRTPTTPEGSDPWQKDWRAFVDALSDITKQKGANQYAIDGVFNGIQVQWSGKVAEVKRPSSNEEYPAITVKLMPNRIPLGKTETVELDDLRLEPSEHEWKSWAGVRPGMTVTFRTTLRKGTLPGWGVLAVMHSMGDHAGETRAWINTEGGMLVSRSQR